MAKQYYDLSPELQKRIISDREKHIINPYYTKNEDAVRRNMDWDKNTLLRPAYVRDVEKIMHVPYYNRYADKTQVFSLYKNDDISRRALHVQLVARIARNIGSLLNLNTDLIEAIALGHDIGHTPFGHAGERYLSACLKKHGEGYFNHNVHSVRVLDTIMNRNISLQTLDGILCHNGEFELKEYRPQPIGDFDDFDAKVKACYEDEAAIKKLVPYTLEACIVRVSDIIAYLGKDRQDAIRAGLIVSHDVFEEKNEGKSNPYIINNYIVNIVENSYGKDYIAMDDEFYEAIKATKKENYEKIYMNSETQKTYEEKIGPMFEEIFDRLLDDMERKDENSIIYRHHIQYVRDNTQFYQDNGYLDNTSNAMMVADYMASMTDDYFVDLYEYLFKKKSGLEYLSYFD